MHTLVVDGGSPTKDVPAADACRTIMIGDIVRAQPPDDDMVFEGVVIDIRLEATATQYHIDFGDEEDPLWCENVQRILPWHAMEIGDMVQARPVDEANYYDGTILGINSDGSFEVLIDGDDISISVSLCLYSEYPDFPQTFAHPYQFQQLPASNVRKQSSARTAMTKFHRAVKKVFTLNYMKKIALETE